MARRHRSDHSTPSTTTLVVNRAFFFGSDHMYYPWLLAVDADAYVLCAAGPEEPEVTPVKPTSKCSFVCVAPYWYDFAQVVVTIGREIITDTPRGLFRPHQQGWLLPAAAAAQQQHACCLLENGRCRGSTVQGQE